MGRPTHRELRNRRRREGSRTNLVIHSNKLDEAAVYNVVQATIETAAIAGPLGQDEQVWSLNENGADTAHYFQVEFDALHEGENNVHLFSGYFKDGGNSVPWIKMEFTSEVGTQRGVWFDLVNVAKGKSDADIIDAGISRESGDWVRTWIKYDVGDQLAGVEVCNVFALLDDDTSGSRVGVSDIAHYMCNFQISRDEGPIDYVLTTGIRIIGHGS